MQHNANLYSQYFFVSLLEGYRDDGGEVIEFTDFPSVFFLQQSFVILFISWPFSEIISGGIACLVKQDLVETKTSCSHTSVCRWSLNLLASFILYQ